MVDAKRDKEIMRRQYKEPTKHNARKNLRDFLVPKFDIHKKSIDELNLKGNESILDVGCGDGHVLLDLRMKRNHSGRLVGLDISAGMFKETQKLQKKNKKKEIEFVEGEIEKLPFEDKSFDIITAFFVLYHVQDIEKSLSEIKRVLKDDGKILVVTMGKERREEIQDLRNKVIKPKFTMHPTSFVVENAKQFLSKFFSIETEFVYDGNIVLVKPEPYIEAFDSVRDFFEPYPTNEEWKEILKLEKQRVEKEIKFKGYFSDKVRNGYFICKKKSSIKSMLNIFKR